MMLVIIGLKYYSHLYIHSRKTKISLKKIFNYKYYLYNKYLKNGISLTLLS